MNLLKSLGTAVLFVAALVMAPAVANAAEYFYGDVYVDDNRGGWEQLYLGDSSDGTYLHLEGTELRCGPAGASYAKMRSIIYSDGDGSLNWSIVNSCENTVRICIENGAGRSACSTYWYIGWDQ